MKELWKSSVCKRSVKEQVRDCRRITSEGQGLQAYYKTGSETAGVVHERVRDCRGNIGEGQRLKA